MSALVVAETHASMTPLGTQKWVQSSAPIVYACDENISRCVSHCVLVKPQMRSVGMAADWKSSRSRCESAVRRRLAIGSQRPCFLYARWSAL